MYGTLQAHLQCERGCSTTEISELSSASLLAKMYGTLPGDNRTTKCTDRGVMMSVPHRSTYNLGSLRHCRGKTPSNMGLCYS